ncbi:lipopolysaccharide-induced tumor necrosis factor-alpha factor homolog [Girardinichthys multiradiatus]|uniref:lipopolysaccharide-induced tumor necrosis factor-alpha factor homolog n=1 Tax=Girardinichthys multiradiatus TaxID=208333 RepID=UPI001FACD093|nr:lipopolysaccharide-induced tumor necrosis factor-alpha factor homolog [Girardinichthys multiradiatus]
MKKGEGPPPDTEVIPDIPAPPYPGPPLDNNVVVTMPKPDGQQHHQPVAQQYPQPVATQFVAQQYPQPVATQFVVQQYPQPGQQVVMQFVGPQGPVVQPVNPVLVVQRTPTDVPGQMHCPYCQNTVVTKTEYQIGTLTWIIFGVLLVVGCWPCCLIPFCATSCQDVQHSCPSCNNVLHTYRHR